MTNRRLGQRGGQKRTVDRRVVRSSRRSRGDSRCRRRTAEEAQRRILEAAEKRLVRGGPEAIRLQDIAADVGISHPAILHHFKSRDGLLNALFERAIANLQDDLINAVLDGEPEADASGESRAARTTRLLERTAETFGRRGFARLLAWLVLSGRDLRSIFRGVFRGFPDTVHSLRLDRSRKEGRSAPSMEDTLFSVTMVIVSVFGDALMGPLARVGVGLGGDVETGRRFRKWMAALVAAYETPREGPGAIQPRSDSAPGFPRRPNGHA